MGIVKGINLDVILDKLEYDQNSVSGFKRRVDWWCGKTGSKYLREPAGTFVGSLNNQGYYTIWADGVSYLAHRVVAKIHGILDDETNTIDHIDGNPRNNLPDNLRCVPKKVNSRNRKLPSTNTSGVMGVSKNTQWKCGKLYERWVAQWRDIGGKICFKSFSFDTYGESTAFKMAVDYRNKMIEVLNADGAGYSERHGETICKI